MRAYKELPNGFEEIEKVDLKSNKKQAAIVNIAAIVIAAAMILIAHFFIVPITEFFDMDSGIGAYMVRISVFLASMVLYIILHELVHGIAMKICGTRKVKYGFTGMYAFACSDDHYDRSAYIFIALAPIVLWGIVLAVLNLFVSEQWFWAVYYLQVMNISGAAGDMYVTFKFLMLPKDILIKDHGVGMTVYSAEKVN